MIKQPEDMKRRLTDYQNQKFKNKIQKLCVSYKKHKSCETPEKYCREEKKQKGENKEIKQNCKNR